MRNVLRYHLVQTCLAFTLVLLASSRGWGQSLPTIRPECPEWKSVARAPLIVVGRLTLAPGRADYLNEKRLAERPITFDALLQVGAVLKGAVLKGKVNTAERLAVRLRSDTVQASLSPEQITGLNGKEVVAFLAWIDYPQPGFAGYYLTSNDAKFVTRSSDANDANHVALMMSSPQQVMALKREVLNQERIARQFAKLPVGKPGQLDEKVGKLLTDLVEAKDDATSYTVVSQLLALGKPAASALIRRMDDRRKLGYPQVEMTVVSPLEEKQKHFAHLEAHLVLDAVNLILGQLLGQEPVYPYALSSDTREVIERGRNEAVKAWRVLLHYSEETLRGGSSVTRNVTKPALLSKAL